MKIIEAPNPVLSRKAQAIRLPFPSDLPGILHQMEKALLSAKDPKGVGLAAPQIGLSLRIFIAKPTDKSKIQVFINPKILASSNLQLAASKKTGSKKSGASGRKQRKLEGCLSLPSVWGTVKRARMVSLSYLDEKGKPHTKKLSGFMAIIAQHETDHLDGVLFPRKVLEQKGKLYKSFKNEKGQVEFEEIEL
ncbi:MAG: hypothetical protein UU21_C0019G0007 [Candidatus Levybacteria bacterium GW2011_GWA2_40_8]|nr:MAG: hypothetical protein UU21_C0019G0007 [Candidatus Levybacteria bacterium GW2011_GWA2_40_8]